MARDIVYQLGLGPTRPKGVKRPSQFFDPFCGSMAPLFCIEPPCQKETVCDLHGDLINLARVLQEQAAAERLYDRLQRVLFSEDLILESKRRLESAAAPSPTDHVMQYMENRAYWYFLASWMGRNGTAGTERIDYQIAVRWTKNGGSPTVRFHHATDSIPAWHQRLRNVVILCRDAFTIIDRFEDVPETCIYVDPPYHDSSRSNGAVKNGRSGRYLHEFDHGLGHEFVGGGMFGEQCSVCVKSRDEHKDGHLRLRDILATYTRARVVVSYYDCPRVRELYDGWTFIDHTRQKHLHAQNGRGARPKEAPELLIVNGPAYEVKAE